MQRMKLILFNQHCFIWFSWSQNHSILNFRQETPQWQWEGKFLCLEGDIFHFCFWSRSGNSFLVNITSSHRGLVVRADQPGKVGRMTGCLCLSFVFVFLLSLSFFVFVFVFVFVTADQPGEVGRLTCCEKYFSFLFRLLVGREWPQAIKWLCHPRFQVNFSKWVLVLEPWLAH